MKGSRMLPQNMIAGVKDMSSPNMPFGMLIVLSWRHLENSRCRVRLSLNSYLSKDRSSKGSSFVINLLPRGSIHQERLTLITGEGTSVPITPRQLSLSTLPLISSSQDSFIFPKNHLLSPESPHPLPFADMIVFNPESQATSLSNSFFLGISLVYMRYSCY